MVVVVGSRALFLWKRFRLWPYDAEAMAKLLLALAISVSAWLVPSCGHPLLDVIARCGVITLAYWSVVFRTDVAPDLQEQVRKILRRLTSVAVPQ